MMPTANEKTLCNISSNKPSPTSNNPESKSELEGVRHLRRHGGRNQCTLERNALLCFNRYEMRGFGKGFAVRGSEGLPVREAADGFGKKKGCYKRADLDLAVVGEASAGDEVGGCQAGFEERDDTLGGVIDQQEHSASTSGTLHCLTIISQVGGLSCKPIQNTTICPYNSSARLIVKCHITR